VSLLSAGFNTNVPTGYTITRTPTGGTTIDGDYTPPASTTITGVQGSMQPVSGRQLRDLREGARADDTKVFYTETPMFTVDLGHEVQDFIDVPDDSGTLERYRVVNVKYHGVLSKHYVVTVERIKTP
jgi:hypothetical protein